MPFRVFFPESSKKQSGNEAEIGLGGAFRQSAGAGQFSEGAVIPAKMPTR
jgi:hypothetical protein